MCKIKSKKCFGFIAVIALAALITAGAFYVSEKNSKIKILSAEEAAQKAINYINENKATLTGGAEVVFIDVAEEGTVYKMHFKIADNEYTGYLTKDGKYLFPGAYDLSPATTTNSQSGGSDSGNTGVVKSDNPDVKLFVMSYCPYGLQAEKMYLPVYNLLKDKADMGIYFVNYAMHGKTEIDENLRQYCIQKEQKDKYYDYLSCFLKAGDYAGCLTSSGVDKTKLDSCVSASDVQYKVTADYNDKSSWLSGQFPKFEVNEDLNKKYGVQGSPTIVINDKIVSVSERSPEKFKEIVCQAFNSAPAECQQTLSGDVVSAGLGQTTGGDSSGGCGG